jgi:hypothetical protein
MGWADDMHEEGYTKEHGGLMDDAPSRSSRSMRYKPAKGKNKSGPGSRWSEDDRNQMIDMYKADVSIIIIAKKLNRTPFAIAYQLYNKNIIPDSIRNKFKEASSFDTSINTINRHINNYKKIKNTKVRKLKMQEDKLKMQEDELIMKEDKLIMKEDEFIMTETVKSILILVIVVIIFISIW